MIYNLAIAEGGGIIDRSLQAEQEECANVIIGLGGTGIDCLKEVKRQVYNRIKPDDVLSDFPTYRHIQFLAIDSDRCSIEEVTFAGIDPSTEFLDISCNIHAVLKNTRVLRQNPSLQWFSEAFPILFSGEDVFGGRQVGRLLMMLKSDRIKETIIHKINKALQELSLSVTKLNIHVFTGMCGSTGSGIFLDTCYIIRHILEELRLTEKAEVFGYFFLPDVNLERVDIETVRPYLKINGFAAMKELDYCMNFQQNGGEWNQIYEGFTVKKMYPPVDMAFLVSATDTKGNMISNGYMYAMKTVADFVIESMTKQYMERALPPLHAIKIKLSSINQKRERGSCYNYCILGASNAYIPYIDINSYLAARIFEAYEELPRSCHDIDTFVSDSGLVYKSLLNELHKAVGAIPMYDVDAGELYNQVQGINPTIIPQLLTQMLQKRPQIIGNIAKNKESLTQNTIMMLRGKLIDFCTDSSRGPIYSALLLRNYNTTDRDMIAVIEGYTQENNKNESQAKATLELREKELAKALREFQSSNKFNRRSRCGTYVSAVHAYLTQDIKVQLYVEMGEFIKAFKPQVTALRDEFFSPLIETMDNVAETFKANFNALNESVVSDNDYAIKIVGLDDDSLKESLNDAVEQLDCKAIVLQFVQHMIDNPKKWESRSNDAQISAMVSEFFATQLNEFTSKSIDSYLQTKYLAPTQAELIDCIYQNEMIPLLTKASPLFWARSTINPESRIGYCSVPSTSVAVQGAVSKLQALDPKIMSRSSVMPDRISMLVFYCGVPMFMFRGLENYYEAYCCWTLTGRHLYENSDEDARDFEELSNLTPLSLINPNDYSSKIKEFVDDYAEAEKAGILYKATKGVAGTQYDYYLRSIDRADCDEKIRQIQTLLKEENIEGIKRFLDDSKNTILTFSSSFKLPNTGCRGYEDSAVKDHVFASLVLTKKMNNQLAVYRKFEKTLNKAKYLVDSTIMLEQEIKAFAEALCSGVICLSTEDKYVFYYIKGDDDFPKKYTLTNMDTEPYGDSIPLYSAFVEFMKLDKEDKAKIAVKVRNRRKHDEDGCFEYSKKIKEYVSKRADLIKEMAAEYFFSERKAICDFVVLIVRNIKSFECSLLK